MVKAVRGINYKGFSDPLPNLDPDCTLIFGSHDLVICRKCLNLYGRLVRVLKNSSDGTKRSGWRYQKCKCMTDENKKSGKPTILWPGNDYNTSVEFCYCCSKRLINSGSRFSSFYCSNCRKLIVEYNNQADVIQIPMGRHSFMNGIKLAVPFSKVDGDQFDKELKGFLQAIDLIKEWQKLRLFENLHDIGFKFHNDISLSHYDSLIESKEDDSLNSIEKMKDFIFEQMHLRSI